MGRARGGATSGPRGDPDRKRWSSPRLLDMFAGGGAIPLEAARLGCEATAVELNPVAHLIEKCMLEYPQRFPGLARRHPQMGAAAGWSGPGTATGATSIRRLLESRSWWPRWRSSATRARSPAAPLLAYSLDLGPVRCPNPALAEHRVPLVRQTWLARKKGRCIALRAVAGPGSPRGRAGEAARGADQRASGFDPAAGTKRGEATCPICGAMVTTEYVRPKAWPAVSGSRRLRPWC